MGRLSARLGAKKAAGEKSLVAYVVAGDPVPEATVPLLHELAAAGVDTIELGVPFSDPEAEGPVIQLAHERALQHHVSLRDCLEMVSAFRQTDAETPVLLMGYLNPIEIMGANVFAESASAAGVDGTIIVNLPPEEGVELDEAFEQHGLEPVYLLAPTTTSERAELICQKSRGFVYYVSLKGTTGAASLDVSDVRNNLERLGRFSDLPILVGFGVKDRESASAVAEVADGAVVGSAIVSLMEQHQNNIDDMVREVGLFVRQLRDAIDQP
jgi:tryptophan synthase alpha chain